MLDLIWLSIFFNRFSYVSQFLYKEQRDPKGTENEKNIVN